jgi:hypothetical protein
MVKLITRMNHADNESSSTLTGPNIAGPARSALKGTEMSDLKEKNDVTADRMTIAESATRPFAPTFFRSIIETMEIKRTAISAFTQPAKFISNSHEGLKKTVAKKRKNIQ